MGFDHITPLYCTILVQLLKITLRFHLQKKPNLGESWADKKQTIMENQIALLINQAWDLMAKL